jgi:hypothetical protein
MKLYKHTPKKIVRVEFLQRGNKCKNLMFEDCTSEEVIEFIKQQVLKERIIVEPFILNKVEVRCFEAEGELKTNNKSITIHGINVEVLHKIIEETANKI